MGLSLLHVIVVQLAVGFAAQCIVLLSTAARCEGLLCSRACYVPERRGVQQALSGSGDCMLVVPDKHTNKVWGVPGTVAARALGAEATRTQESCHMQIRTPSSRAAACVRGTVTALTCRAAYSRAWLRAHPDTSSQVAWPCFGHPGIRVGAQGAQGRAHRTTSDICARCIAGHGMSKSGWAGWR
jgi:hypothetical protein